MKHRLQNENRKAVLLTAPLQFNTWWNGTTTSWFDVHGHFDKEEAMGHLLQLDFCSIYKMIPNKYGPELVDAAEVILSMVEAEAALLATEESDGFGKVFIGGFSQGAILSLGTLMHHYKVLEKPIGGYFALSGTVPTRPDGASDDCHAFSFPPEPTGDQAAMMA